VELARTAFRNLVQLDAVDFALSGELDYRPEKLPLEAWQTMGLAGRPELLYQQRVLDLSKLDIRAERGALRPQVRAHGAYQGLNPESGTAQDAWDWGWNAGVSLDWDLFDGGLRRRVVLEKNLELAKAREDLADLERAVDLEIRQYYLELATADETVAASRETVALAEKSLEIARTRYQTGLSTYLEYTDANLALSTARLTWLTALRDHANALARLQCASGHGYENEEKETP
jgi:outer membrane protein